MHEYTQRESVMLKCPPHGGAPSRRLPNFPAHHALLCERRPSQNRLAPQIDLGPGSRSSWAWASGLSLDSDVTFRAAISSRSVGCIVNRQV